MRNLRHGKLRLVDQPFSTLNTCCARHSGGRRAKVFAKQSRQMTRSYPEPIGKIVDTAFVQCAFGNQPDCARHRCA